MKARLPSPRRLLSWLGVVVVAGAVVWLTLRDTSAEDRKATHPVHPPLFGAPPKCSTDIHTFRHAARLEQHGHLYAERYPYDPRDGIRAVRRFQEAQSCYSLSGREDDAKRVARHAFELMTRLDMDYASARLVLETALATQRWSVAHAELGRLLRLTEHLSGHDYVDWLERLVGKVAVRARNTP
jgi:hypothetical protein